MLKVIEEPFNIVDALCDCLEVNYEYSPGLYMKVKPYEIYWMDFYPHREGAPTVKIILQDGERLMDKLLFEKLYKFSKNPAEEIFPGPLELLDGIPFPFNVEEFDYYYIFLGGDLEGIDPETIDCYIDKFLAYFKITHFLMPEDDRLYAPESIPVDFLGYLDLSLDLFPPYIIKKIVLKCDIIKYSDNSEVIRSVYRDFEPLKMGPEITKEFFALTEKTAKSMGLHGVENFRWTTSHDFYWSGERHIYGQS